ncbi:vegetative cell wall protein gp1-like [Salvia miltiorrhiza]|uniref:vegetative cell wall protein gp1-like n=1 Tax=Salvia miltiorrhiza TaxID=226208 RepID=UPI0025ABD004|nr:vegetative cell wall protein gp1-like [Salvia miltiorrhiza]
MWIIALVVILIVSKEIEAFESWPIKDLKRCYKNWRPECKSRLLDDICTRPVPSLKGPTLLPPFFSPPSAAHTHTPLLPLSSLPLHAKPAPSLPRISSGGQRQPPPNTPPPLTLLSLNCSILPSTAPSCPATSAARNFSLVSCHSRRRSYAACCYPTPPSPSPSSADSVAALAAPRQRAAVGRTACHHPRAGAAVVVHLLHRRLPSQPLSAAAARPPTKDHPPHLPLYPLFSLLLGNDGTPLPPSVSLSRPSGDCSSDGMLEMFCCVNREVYLWFLLNQFGARGVMYKQR